jgi:hypothetical protein
MKKQRVQARADSTGSMKGKKGETCRKGQEGQHGDKPTETSCESTQEDCVLHVCE